MHGEDRPKPIETGYLSQDVTKVPRWHGLVAWDLLFNNLTTGLFLFAGIGELAMPAVLRPVARAAYPFALAFLLIDLTLLVMDLGDPLRFHHMLRVFKPSSPMSLGTWSLTVYSLPLTFIVAIEAAQWLGMIPADSSSLERARQAAVILGLFPAFGSLAYKGVLFSTSSQPGWKDARWLGGFMASSALLLGCVQLMALAVFTRDERAAAALRIVSVALVLLNLVPAGLLISELHRTLVRIYPDRQVYLVLLCVVVVSAVVPLLLLLAGSGTWLLGAVVLVVLGSLGARYLFIKIPHASRERRSAPQVT
jgi:hypothetical protein